MSDDLDLQPACDPSLSRAQFIRLLIERATLAGVLVAIPAIADSFMAPPAVAQVSGGQVGTSLSFQNPVA
jgi:hypothetical protein